MMSPTYVGGQALGITAQTWKDPVPVVLVNGSFSLGSVSIGAAVEIKDANGNLAEIPRADAAKSGANHVVLVQNVDDQGAILRRSDVVDIDLNTATTNLLLLTTNAHLAAVEETGTRSLTASGQQLTALSTLQTLLAALKPSIIVTASEKIDKYLPITANGSIASSSDLSTFGAVVGISIGAANTGQPVEVAISNEVVNSSWSWLTGQSVYVGVKSVAGTVAAFGYVQQLGIAKNSSTVVVNVQQPILL